MGNKVDGPIRANRFAASRESPGSRESFRGSRTDLRFLRIALWGAKNCESQVRGDSRESLARDENKGFSANRFARIAPIRVANRRAI